jgi:hypothetical protein
MAVITIGEAAIDRASAVVLWSDTLINRGQTASGTGKITNVQIYMLSSANNVEVATFYEVTSNHFTTRDTAVIGNIGSGFSSHSIELDVQIGDYIGITSDSSGNIEIDITGYNGRWAKTGDYIPCTNVDFGAYVSDFALSLYGTGVTPVLSTVSVQAVTDINETTATGNGNITNMGYQWGYCTKKGICWNKTGTPTVSDSKSEESGSFGTGAFTRPMTGLARGDKYFVRAYAYNSVGLSYSPTVEDFYTYPSVTTYAPIDIIRADPTVVTANALIELDVVENITTRGFKYGLTETDTWSEYEEGTFEEGTFSLQITGLTADLTYYIRAYAIGAWGTKYGSYVQFKTGYPYGSFKTVIEAEATASQSDIDAVGGKRSLTIENHLIQNQTVADLISAAYLADYKDQKTKLVVTRPCPAPYIIGDTIKRESATISYAAAGSAIISYAAATNSLYYYNLAGRNMLIRKLNIDFNAGNYTSVIELED